MILFNAQVRDQTESVAVKGQANKAKGSNENQALKAKRLDTNSDQDPKASDSVSNQITPNHPESESKSPRSVQFKLVVSYQAEMCAYGNGCQWQWPF